MRCVPVFLSAFVLFFVLSTDKGTATPSKLSGTETEFSFSTALPSDQAMFSSDVGVFRGQSVRRHIGSGRIWGNLYYGDTTLKPKGGGRIRPDFYGFQIGLDFERSPGVHATYFFNLNQSKARYSGDFSGINSSNTENYLFGYGRIFYFDLLHLVFTGCLGYDRYEVSAAGNKGKGDGLQTNLFGEFGLNFILGRWAIKPFYALQYDFLYHGRIGNSPALVSDWNGHGLQQLFGLRLNWKATQILEFQCRSIWVHEYLDNPPPFYRARFSRVHGVSTPTMKFHQGNIGRDWAWLGIGTKLELAILHILLDYDVLLNERQITHIGSFGLCINW